MNPTSDRINAAQFVASQKPVFFAMQHHSYYRFGRGAKK